MNEHEIQTKLQKLYEKKWLTNRLGPAPGVSEEDEQELKQLLNPKKFGWHNANELHHIEATAKWMDGRSNSDMRSLWKILFPRLAPYVYETWLDAPNRPFGVDYMHPPFRMPNRTDFVRWTRAKSFRDICNSLRGVNLSPTELAAWAPHLGGGHGGADEVPTILATILRSGGSDADAVRQIFIESVEGTHEIGDAGMHIFQTFLESDQRADWEEVGQLLLAAKREEGLRETILMSLSSAHPDAFRYMLGVIVENNLGRFSSVVQAFDEWLSFQWAGGSAKVVRDGVTKLCAYDDDATERETAITNGEAEDAYLALWMTAIRDADAALKHAGNVLKDDDAERRFAAIKFIRIANVHPDSVDLIASHILSGRESDERVFMEICGFLGEWRADALDVPSANDVFDALVATLEGLPTKKVKLEPILWPWCTYTWDRATVASAMFAVASKSPMKMLPYAASLNGYACTQLIHQLAGVSHIWDPKTGRRKTRRRRKLSPDARAFVVRMLADKRQDVHEAAFLAMEPAPLEDDEVDLLMSNLHRTGASFRRGAIERLAALPPKRRFEVASTLLADKHAKKQAAGLELASTFAGEQAWEPRVPELVRPYVDAFKDEDMARTAKRLVEGKFGEPSAADCFGLVPEGSRMPSIKPKFVGVKRETPAARACLISLAKLFIEHGETEIQRPASYGEASGVDHITSYFPRMDVARGLSHADRDRVLADLPLRHIWQEWVESRPKNLRDADGLELTRMWAIVVRRAKDWKKGLPSEFLGPGWRSSLEWAFDHLVSWIPWLDPQPGTLAFIAQSAEDLLAKPDPKEDARYKDSYDETTALGKEFRLLEQVEREVVAGEDSEKVLARIAALRMLAVERGINECESGPSLAEFAAAFKHGLLNDYDFAWNLLFIRHADDPDSWRSGAGPIRSVTTRKPPSELAPHKPLIKMINAVRDRILEIELDRGERVGPATVAASHIEFAGGADVLFKLMTALGRDKIVRQWSYGERSRAYSFSELISRTLPMPKDTHDRFAALYSESGMTPERLIEFAMFAPQWSGHIEHIVEIPGFEDAVWWIHAHTKQGEGWHNRDIRDIWASHINERTELEPDDLEDGAVDVAWFNRVIDAIGIDTWDRLRVPAKYASNSAGHKRAELFATAMLDGVEADELLKRIDEKRNQDSARALGLVPLPKSKTKAQAETLRRYKRMQEFKRESRQFGSQRQASEGRAVDIGMENLARTAGYRDPRRLEWAMEAEAVADLANGPVSETSGETTVSLVIDDAGAPVLSVIKSGKPLKNIPAKLRKHPPFAELRSRVTDLRRQASRMRRSLEEAMCRGDVFTAGELVDFLKHPVLQPMVERLVFVSADEDATRIAGYPEKKGKVLRDHDGTVEPVSKKDVLRLAHPTDFFARGDWSDWQKECFAAERVQPFKQIFRELYVRTSAEKGKQTLSRRYAGHQVNPRQALALLKQRQWVIVPEEGVRRVFHDQRLVAELCFQEHFYTAAEVDGLTLEGLTFRPRGTYEVMPLAKIPDRIFSETMRDLDLVVSVAHAGGVDPEASTSTVEMRATLLKQTARLLGLSNVRIKGHHALIDGTRGSYSLHLGSATTKVLPGRDLIIVAIHSQYRGRLFLPFADDDPRTAEVLAKALLLARDHEIKDPLILQQI